MNVTTYTYRQGGSKTLSEALDYAALSASKLRFFNTHGNLAQESTYTELRLKALKLASYLNSLGYKRGSYIAMIAQTRLEFHIVFFACQYAGLIPCPLSFTVMPGGQEAYEKKLLTCLKLLKPALIVSPASIKTIANNVGVACGAIVTSYEALADETQQAHPSVNAKENSLKENELAYVQFSSGSTSDPSGLLITQKALMANLNSIATDGNSVMEHEQIFSWLPFDHNMGLVSFIFSVTNTQSNADYIAPSTFMAQPQLWLELMSQCRSTLTFAPIFAYELAMQKRNPDKALNLSYLRIAGIGGDMINISTLRSFAETMKDTGFRYETFSPGYGLAEMVMAVATTRPENPPFTHLFPEISVSQELVSCGKVLSGFSIKIEQDEQSSSSEHPSRVGEIWVKGPSLVTDSLNAQEKLRQDADGYITTGDYGFLYEDHLFITGRLKDMIIIRGRNIWAQDIEWAVTGCDPRLHKHSAAAIGITENHEERLVVLIQNENYDSSTRAALAKQILQTINQTFAVRAQIVWVATNQLATTTVGKLARVKIKQDYLDGKLSIIG